MSYNLFDDDEASLHYDVAETFGYMASWLPASGETETPYTAKVLFQDPKGRGGITEHSYLNYEDPDILMEYYLGQFPGLRESVETSQETETIFITKRSAVIKYHVTRVYSVIDGDTLVAKLVYISEAPIV